MVDRLEEKLPQWKQDFGLHTLVINADNGPESNGRRTQWLKRLVALSRKHAMTFHGVFCLISITDSPYLSIILLVIEKKG